MSCYAPDKAGSGPPPAGLLPSAVELVGNSEAPESTVEPDVSGRARMSDVTAK